MKTTRRDLWRSVLCTGLTFLAMTVNGLAQAVQTAADVYYQEDGSSVAFLAVEAEGLPVTTVGGTTNCTWFSTADASASDGQALAADGGTLNQSDYNAFTLAAQFALAGQYTMYWRARANVVGSEAVGDDDSWWIPSEGGNDYATLAESPAGQPPFPGAWVNNYGGGGDPWRNQENSTAFGVEYDWYRIAGGAGTFRGFQVDPADLGSTFSVSFVTRETGYGVDGLVFVDTPGFTGIERADLALMLSGPSAVPTVTLQPLGQEVALGEAFTLAVAGGGSQPFSVQWRRNSAPLAGETNDVLTVPAAGLADGGTYDAVLTSASGPSTSDGAVVTIVAPPVDPPIQTALQTFPATFTVQTAATNMTFQWFHGASLLTGETQAVLTVSNVTLAEAGTYTVDVTFGGDTLTGGPAELLVPAVSTQSYPDIVTGAGPNFYWRLGDPAGSTEAAPTVGGLSLLDINLNTEFGRPGVVLGDADTAVRFLGDAYLESEDWSEFLEPPQFSVELWARSTGGDGEQGLFSVRDFFPDFEERYGYDVTISANGQWTFRTGTGVGGEDWNTLTGPQVEVGAWTHLVCTYDGADMRMYVNGALRGVLTGAAYPQNFLAQWAARVGAGENELGQPTTLFQGEMDEVSLYPSALSPTEVLSHWAGVFDPTALPLVSGPEDTGAQIGQSVQLRVGVISGTFPTYQWRKDGVDMVGQTNATLVFDPLLGTDAGSYDCRVTNTAGPIMSRTVTLVPLVDYLINFTVPDSSNTVLTRDPPTLWYNDNNTTSINSGLWRRRPSWGVPSESSSTVGYQAFWTAEPNGDLELETTLSDLIPGELYSVWVFYVYKDLPPFAGNPGGPCWIRCGFDYDTETGLLPQWRPDNSVDTGENTTDDGTWDVLYGFLGTRIAEPDGTISILTDFDEANERSVLAGFGYQETNPLPEPPNFTQQPVTQAVLLNGNANFSASAISQSPVGYQWQKDAIDLAGETNKTLSLTGVTAADGGLYQVVATNDQGSATSETGELVVIQSWVNNFVFPTLDNTVLMRDPGTDWFTLDQAAADSNALWFADANFAVPGLAPPMTNGFFLSRAATLGEVRLVTTISGLTADEPYAVWALYSYDNDIVHRPTIDWPDAAPPRVWTPGLSEDAGLFTGAGGNIPIYAAFLGITNAPPSGEVSFIVDKLQSDYSRVYYNGAAYQRIGAVTPLADLNIEGQGGQIVVRWPESGQRLQEATDLLLEDWTLLPAASSPYTNNASAPAAYWRLIE